MYNMNMYNNYIHNRDVIVDFINVRNINEATFQIFNGYIYTVMHTTPIGV